jgi:hypothetical protein
VLAVLPAVYGVSLTLPVSGFNWNPVEYAFLGFAFYLASVVLAAFDEYHLRQAGVVDAATAYWSLLTPMPYLIARTRALIAADQPGLALLWIAIVSSLLTGVALAILAVN